MEVVSLLLFILFSGVAIRKAYLLGRDQAHQDFIRNGEGITLFFSPRGGCEAAIVTAIDQAQEEILVQAYEFTSAAIAKALVRAADRHLRVEMIIDPECNNSHSQVQALKSAHVVVLVDSEHNAFHNKVILVDQRVTITGSLNFTKNAEYSNAENVLVINNPEIAERFKVNYNYHRNHSVPLP